LGEIIHEDEQAMSGNFLELKGIDLVYYVLLERQSILLSNYA